jgi:hypothetical protein
VAPWYEQLEWNSGWQASPSARSHGALIAIVVYLVAARVAFNAYLLTRPTDAQHSRPWHRFEPRTWLSIAAGLGALAISRIFALEDLVTSVFRYFVARHGWYLARRPYQFIVVTVLSIYLVLILRNLPRWTHEVSRELRAAMVTMILCVAFNAIRTCSFHYIDGVLEARFLGLQLGWLLEAIFAGLTGLAAASLVRKKTPVSRMP